jgi:cytochrome c oxidase subunit 4
MTRTVRRLVLAWATLLVLLALQVGGAFLPLGDFAMPAALLLALMMTAVVAFAFMEVGRGPVLVLVFAGAGLFWLVVLFSLGGADYLTRLTYPVSSEPNHQALADGGRP